MNVGKLFREDERLEASTLLSKATPPRQWAVMLETWRTLFGALVLVLGGGPEEGGLVRHLWMWRWAWALPPCSEARKAALTLGAAALLIERWRGTQEIGEAMAPLPEDVAVGQRAEAELRIAAWHVEDARGEAHARTLGHEPTIPPHERVYEASARAADDMAESIFARQIERGILFAPAEAAKQRGRLARLILNDHFEHRPGRGELVRAVAQDKAFTETAIASLPDGPWVMTSRDVEAFLRLITEGATRDGAGTSTAYDKACQLARAQIGCRCEGEVHAAPCPLAEP